MPLSGVYHMHMAKKRKPAAGKPGGNPWPDRLRALRKRLGLNQSEAAARIAVGPGVWSAWENDLRTPSRQSQLLIELLEAGTI